MSPPDLCDLSIVIAAQGSAAQTARCLESLRNQNGVSLDQFEIIVEGDGESDGVSSLPAVASSLPAVPASLPVLHGAGMEKAVGKLIAITESHCTFPPNWVSTAIKLHAAGSASAIGGTVLPGRDLQGMNFALFLCDYIQFLPPVEAAYSNDLPGNNIVFKRECLPEKTVLARDGFWKTFYCHDLESKGEILRIEPDLAVIYNRELTASEIMARRYHHGRCFGGMRAQKSSAAKRAMLFAAGPALPFLLMTKLLKRASPKNEGLELVFAHLPWIWLLVTTWAYGEWVGNLFGSGKSCQRL